MACQCAGIASFSALDYRGDMDDLIFRRATEADLPAIVALLADDDLGAKRENPVVPLENSYLAAFAAIDADPNQLLAIGEIGGDIVGTLQLTFIDGISRKGSRRGVIEAVRTSASYRGQGIGQRIFEWAIAECRARGCAMVQLTTHKSRTDAHRFYERIGFKASHIGFKLEL